MTTTLHTDEMSGIERKTIGQAKAVSGASEWYLTAQEEITRMAKRRKNPFTADDLIERVGLPNSDGAENSNNAVGPVFSWARRKGLIKHVGYTQSARPSSNARVISMWAKA